MKSQTIRVRTGLGNLYITILEQNNKPCEILCTIGKSGGSVLAKAESISRLVSLALKHNVPLEDIVNELIGISGSEPTWHNGVMIKSIPDALGRTLKDLYLKEQ